ncbi:MAG: N-acetyl-gamma-glutamyl-phosphate reductase [Proteobacteria bacterium]|nr:N-acetyl-gamma-glutamyl-phosphate reductase [Pseudomonadota bacterium]
MIRAGIIGVTGYVGIEICRILHQHPQVKVTYVTTKTYVGDDIAAIYPHLQGIVFHKGAELNVDVIIQECDLIFISLPYGQAVKIVPLLLAAGKRVIDAGPDFRLKNPSDYVQWYKLESAPVELLNKAVYGLPEITNKDNIAKSNLIANPGCNSTAVLLATYPALKHKIIQPNECIFDVKVGLSGAGREPDTYKLYSEIAENIFAIQVAGLHRHTPEIEQELSLIAEEPILAQFSLHIVPITRGILVTACYKLKEPKSAHEIYTLYKRTYENEPFIRICRLGSSAKVKNVRGTNYCDISIHVDVRTQRLIVLSAIDNMIKGAAGQAVQNMNLMYQLPQTTGLDKFVAIYP